MILTTYLHLNRRLLVALIITFGVTIYATVGAAFGEGPRPKVLTLEKPDGPEVAVGDKLAASLEAGTESKFISGAGTVACKESKFEGKVKSNPESMVDGSGVAEIEITSFTFGKCTSNVGGAGGSVESITADTPWIATTEDVLQLLKIKGSSALQIEVLLNLKTVGGGKIECAYLARITADYESGSAQIVIAQKEGQRGCPMCAGPPEWKANYAPLKDETVGSKDVYMN